MWNLAQRLQEGLGVRVDSPIVPVLIGAEVDALHAAGSLLGQGFHVPAIRPPTVKPGTCRCPIIFLLVLSQSHFKYCTYLAFLCTDFHEAKHALPSDINE